MTYDVFLSHNSEDKPYVRAVADWLRNNGVRQVWLDEANLEPGDRLTDKLGQAMEECRSAIVFIGRYGEGGWQREEIDTLLNKAIKLSRQKDEFRIIPVLLPDADTTNLRWFLQTRLWVDLSQGVTDSGAELARLRQAILGKAAESPVQADPNFNPYKGLAAFQVGDAPFFFGRGAATRELAVRLKEWRFACVIGPSGSGKSSLARAGLATESAETACPGIRSWRRVTLVPGSNLLRSFLEQLNASLPHHDRAEAVAKAMERVDPTSRVSTAEEWAERLDAEFSAWSPDPDQPVLFLVDQFEEVFTHRGLRNVIEAERDSRIRRLLDCLAILAMAGERRWRFVFTIREDFFQRCRTSTAFWNLVSVERLGLRLDELDEQGWREAIKGPAARAGAYLEAGLVEAMLKDVYRQRGSMPLLQLALKELWRLRQGACLTHGAYTTMGGVANALQNRATSAFRLLGQDKHEYLEIARNLFLRLTSLGEGVTDTRRRLDRAELSWEKTDPKDLEHVLTRLSDADHRLIVANEHSVEVTHEVLIRESEDIRAWLDGPEGARKEIPILRRLTHAAQRWELSGRDPVFLNASDPPRELKQWATSTRLRLTGLEREYWSESRAQRARDLRSKRGQKQALRNAEKERLEQAEERRREAEERATEREEARRTAVRRLRFALFASILAFCAVGIIGFMWNHQIQLTEEREAALIRANEATQSSQEALLKNLYRSIGTSNEEEPPTNEEREALWELATLGPENRAIRSNLLSKWSLTFEGVSRASLRKGKGFKAATGLDMDFLEVSRFTENLIRQLETARESDSELLAALSQSLAVFAAKAAPGPAAQSATNLVRLLETTSAKEWLRLNAVSQSLAAFAVKVEPGVASHVVINLIRQLDTAPEEDLNLRFAVSQSLAAFAVKVEPGVASHVVTNLIRQLDTAPENDLNLRFGVSESLAAYAVKVKSGPAAHFASNLVHQLGTIPETDEYRLGAVSKCLSAFAVKVEPGQAAHAVTNLIRLLETVPTTDWNRRGALSESLEAFAAKIEPSLAADVVINLIWQLETAPETDLNIRLAASSSLAAFSAKAEPGFAAQVVTNLIRQLETAPETDQVLRLAASSSLEAFAAKVEPSFAAAVVTNLIGHLETAPETDQIRRFAISSCLAAFAVKVEPGPVAHFATNLIRQLETVADDDSNLQFSLLASLAAFAMKVDPAPLAHVVINLTRQLESARDTDWELRFAVADSLAALAEKAEPGPAAHVVTNLFQQLETALETDMSRLGALSESLAAFAVKVKPGPAAHFATNLVQQLGTISETDENRLGAVSKCLSAFAVKVEPGSAAHFATNLVQQLGTISETDGNRLGAVSKCLSAFAVKVELGQAAHAVTNLIRLLEIIPETDRKRRGAVLLSLMAFNNNLPRLSNSRDYVWDQALGYISFSRFPREPKLKYELLEALEACHSSTNTSVESSINFLKWPDCVGQFEAAILAGLGNKLKIDFGGDIALFTRLAPSLGIPPEILASPAKRPTSTAALKELDEFLAQQPQP